MTTNIKRVPLFLLATLLASCAPGSGHQEAAIVEQKEAAPAAKADAPVNAQKAQPGLPEITLLEENGTQFSATSLPGKTILIFFFSDCDHCQREAADVQKHLIGFAEYSIYFISMDAFPAIHKFASTYKLDHQPNVHFVRADGKTVYESMGSIETPTICVFGKTKKLVQRFDGETNVQKILAVL